jgi:hypothetical protein
VLNTLWLQAELRGEAQTDPPAMVTIKVAAAELADIAQALPQ